jgi:hypothetical protein
MLVNSQVDPAPFGAANPNGKVVLTTATDRRQPNYRQAWIYYHRRSVETSSSGAGSRCVVFSAGLRTTRSAKRKDSTAIVSASLKL